MKALVKICGEWVEAEVCLNNQGISICGDQHQVLLETSLDHFTDMVDLGEVIPKIQDAPH